VADHVHPEPLPDNHNHFMAWGDADAMVAAAAAAGVGELIFTEHVFHMQEARALSPYLATRFIPEGTPIDHATYMARIEAAAAAAPIPVRAGIELDVRAEDLALEAATTAFRSRFEHHWDVVIGSVHVIAGDVSVDGSPTGVDPAAAWRDYLDRLVAAVETRRYDVVSHPVRLAVTVPEVPAFLADGLDVLAAAATRAGVALEVNGSDLIARPELVTVLAGACARHGTPVSLGSDAHRPVRGGAVVRYRQLLRECGLRTVVGFVRRTPFEVAL
jgi:histidinol phosphatase-like PHP family hydrolase